MAGELDNDVNKAVEHVKESTESNDLSKVIEDLKEDLAKRGAQDKSFEEALNKALHDKGLLPKMNIEGVDDKGRLLVSNANRTEFGAIDASGKGEKVETRSEARALTAPAENRTTAAPDVPQRPTENTVTKDAQGRVVKVDYPSNGKSQEFTRDANGDIIKVRNEDKETWTKGKDDTWTLEGSNPAVTWKGKLSTDDKGNYTKEAPDGVKYIERADGSQVDLDKAGHPTRIKTPDGKVRTCKYDASGNVSEISGPGSEKLSTADGGKTWTRTDAQGKQSACSEVKVSPEGNVEFKGAAGERVTQRSDGGAVTVNEKGQVAKVVDAKGNSYEFGFDANGKLNSIKDATGTWSSQDGHNWTNEKGVKWAGSVGVDKEGNYWYQSDAGNLTWHKPDGSKVEGKARPSDQPPQPPRPGDQPPQPPKPGDQPAQPGQEKVTMQDGVKITEYPDGFKVKDYPDGSQVEVNEKGLVTFVKSGPPQSATRFFEYDQQGQVVKVKGIDGDTWHRNPQNPNEWMSEGGQAWRGTVVGVDANGNAHYRPERGAPFVLTREGRVTPEGAQGGQGGPTDANQRHRAGDQPTQPGQPQQGGDRPVAPISNQGDKPPTQPTETPEQKKEREAKEEKARQEKIAAERKIPKPNKPSQFAPKDGTYNPMGPPGVGDLEPGKAAESETETGKGNTPIDYRKAESKDNGDGTVSYKYEGELEDSGLMPWNWGDTNFTGSEKWTKDGRLLERHAEYDGGITLKVDTGSGAKELENVTKVDTVYNPNTGNYDTSFTTSDGTIYRATSDQDGKVTKWEKATGDKQTDTAGDSSAQVGNFNATDGQFNPVRPSGLGELRPGQATSGEKNGIDWRESRAETNPDGSTTYHYDGELEDSGLMPWNWGDTNYSASEKVDKNGNLVETHVKYDGSVDQTYVGPNGEKVEVSGVQQVDSVRGQDGNFTTTMKTSDGKTWTFKTGPNGKVMSVQRPK